MGESRRRKQLLGSRYGKPLGLSRVERITLIDQNIGKWISEHFDNLEYDNYLENPRNFQTRYAKGVKQPRLEQVIKNASEHFSNTFNETYPDASIKSMLQAMLKDQAIIFEGVSLKERQKVEPTIALPLARKYFQRQVRSRKIELSTHYILVKEALIVLGSKTTEPLLEKLLWGEVNEVIISAQEEKLSWLMKNLNTDGWIDMSEELIFQTMNRAIVGILTVIGTLPWSMQLDLVAD